MKISKYLHSCLLVEDRGKTILIDPGVFTAQEKALDLSQIKSLDYLLFTHEHPDHMYLPFVKEIVAKFPEVKIITNDSIVTILQKEDIKASSTQDAIVKLESVPHEKLWDSKIPENTLITVFDKLATPGDSHHFSTSVDVLALPIQAPWGSTTDAINLVLSLKPKMIIPIHDWMWKDGFRQMMYQRLAEFFKTKGIDFKSPKTGEIMDI